MFYEKYEANVEYVEAPFEHTWPLDIEDNDKYPVGGDCNLKGVFRANCEFDYAGKVLEHLLLNLPDSDVTELKPMDLEFREKGVLRKFS